MDLNSILGFLKHSGTIVPDPVTRWLSDPENEARSREILGSVWTNNEITLKDKKPDFEKMLACIHHRINLEKSAAIVPRKKLSREKSVPLSYRIAAILVVPLFITSVLFFVSIYNKTIFYAPQYAERELVTKPGTRMKIRLDDGTVVWLNDGTTFRYPEKFSGNERRVFVDGEAYFDVACDTARSFIVENPMVETMVCGTSFNLRGYTSDNYFEMTLVKGKVKLKKYDHKIVMMPGQQVQFDNFQGKFSSRKVDPSIYSSWIDGKLILKDERFDIAMMKLSRWYNVDIVIQDKELNNILLTATLQDEKIEQTLEHIAYALPVKYRIKKEVINDKLKTTIDMMKK